MKNFIMATLMAIVPMSAFAQNVTPGKIAELTAHRIERLVQINKISPAFDTMLEKVEVSVVTGQAPVAFKSVTSQSQPATGSAIQLELLFDATGKPLSFKEVAGVAGADPKWPTANAQALYESATHFLDDNKADPKISPFYAGTTTLVLAKGKLQGMDVCRVQISATTTASKLNVYLMLDGMVMSSEIVP
jgi:hypothetical protein